MTEEDKIYPCSFPFEQLYLVPRKHFDFRFCCYHEPVFLENQEELFDKGLDVLNKEFLNNKELENRRQKFIDRNFSEINCNEGCYWYNVHKMTGQGYCIDDYKDDNGNFKLHKFWLSVGPDCNATCRYCLEPQKHCIDFNSCNPKIMDIAYEFVKNGHYIILTGGETFLPKFRFLEILDKLSKDNNVKGYFDCHTNASLLNKEAREIILRAPLHTLNVSMDTFRKDLFNYLRRGLDFDTVLSNVRNIIKERDEKGLEYPKVNILCTLLVANCDHIIETAENAIKEGCTMSINGIFQAPFSPDFSREQSLNNLSLSKLQRVYDDVLYIKEKYGDKIETDSILGQLKVFIDSAKNGESAQQVILGGIKTETYNKNELNLFLSKYAENKNLYLYGASSRGNTVFNIIGKNNIKGFIDSNERKKGTQFNEKDIYHYSDIKDLEKPYIIISSAYTTEITKTLLELGLKEKEDFISIENFR